MTIEKLSSGNYRIRKYFEGKRYDTTIDHKPTAAEAEKIIMRSIMNQKAILSRTDTTNMTFREAGAKMIEDKYNVLSPSTIKDYTCRLKLFDDSFAELRMDNITQQDVQREINRLAKTRSGKTVANYYALVTSIFAYSRPDIHLSVNLPPKRKYRGYTPTTDEVKAIIELSKGTVYEIPVLMGCLGMRRSEICALTEDDIDYKKCTITIDKAKVRNEHNEWVIKPTPKTDESNRVITVPQSLIDVIQEKGLYHGSEAAISYWMKRVQDANDMPHFSLHRLRSYFASITHKKNVPDIEIMKMGGWKTDYVMKQVYRNALEESSGKISHSILSDFA